jgi:hypothetical protein
MNAHEKNVAVARGEALAAILLASAALQTALAMALNREEIITRISAFIDDTPYLRGPGSGNANDEPNTLMCETARLSGDAEFGCNRADVQRSSDEMNREQKITFAEMRDMGVRSVLIYCADCHSGSQCRSMGSGCRLAIVD